MKIGTACFALIIGFSSDVFAQDDQPIAQELVGKWCYINLATTNDQVTNSCVTLNADGTYEAILDRANLPRNNSLPGIPSNDSGKWWTKNDRLFYQSSANGQGSFAFQKQNHPRLENTPMIVFNGVAFATATPRDPW